MDTPMAKNERLKISQRKKELDDMDRKEFNKLRTRTTRKLSTRDTLTRVWQAFGHVQSKTKSIRVEPAVFGKSKEHLILVPPDEPMLLFTGGWLDPSILQWFSMSLRKWAAKKVHPECKYMAPRLIEERRCCKE
ncbi:hypothetical protein Tco_0398110 [Tanacetum coccineum]